MAAFPVVHQYRHSTVKVSVLQIFFSHGYTAVLKRALDLRHYMLFCKRIKCYTEWHRVFERMLVNLHFEKYEIQNNKQLANSD